MEELENKIWQITEHYLSQATPEQWHIYAASSNYDGNSQGLMWLIDNPALDRATALLIYWYAGAAWYAQFGSVEEIPSYQLKTYHFIQKIEQRFKQHFYSDYGIWFDPMTSEGGSPNDYPERPVKKPISEVMKAAVGGKIYVDIDADGYEDGLPLVIAEQIFALYES